VIEPDEALILGEMVKHGKQVIAVADASKLGMFASVKVCATSELHTIITDDSVDPTLVEAFEEKHVRVVVV
jgi:DeoR family transcriptional regulator of aga operon